MRPVPQRCAADGRCSLFDAAPDVAVGNVARDCHEALELNPYHFIAATCMGQAYLELENPVSALESFRRAETS